MLELQEKHPLTKPYQVRNRHQTLGSMTQRTSSVSGTDTASA